ncbi:translation initiation factor IF-3, mitochondrial [Genypterus blacodes]|uniref:translation initiation factor IF-3, mitochondrial n=1 Tax=Genypterus blacodes TaxID=154954 RepID=UPI003F76C98A
MSAGCLWRVFSHGLRGVCGGSGSCGYWTSASRVLICSRSPNILTPSWRFCTAVDGAEQTPAPKKKKKDPRARATINSVGRLIPYRQIQVISETGENMGNMHRADAIKHMDEHNLKLVLLSEHKDPPVYRLMSGRQIHEEQLKLREQQKAKAGLVQVKELTFSSSIGTHDLRTKLKQVESWLDKKHHVKMTLRSGRQKPTATPDTTLEQMVQQMDVLVGFVSKPKVIRDGKAAVCIIRPPSAKELALNKKNKTEEVQPSDSTSQSTQTDTSNQGADHSWADKTT